jgi:hypothetical protein
MNNVKQVKTMDAPVARLKTKDRNNPPIIPTRVKRRE